MRRVRFMEPFAALSDRTRKAFQLAHQEAHRLNHAVIGIEHLLLGFAKETLSPATTALRQAGFDLNWLRKQIEARWPAAAPSTMPSGALPYAEDLEAFFGDVLFAGETSGMLPLTPEALLLALAEQPDGVVRQILGQRRLWFWWLRRRLRGLTEMERARIRRARILGSKFKHVRDVLHGRGANIPVCPFRNGKQECSPHGELFQVETRNSKLGTTTRSPSRDFIRLRQAIHTGCVPLDDDQAPGGIAAEDEFKTQRIALRGTQQHIL